MEFDEEIKNAIQTNYNEIKNEESGERGVAYEKFGSGINDVLTPALEIIELLKDSHPDLVLQFTNALIN